MASVTPPSPYVPPVQAASPSPSPDGQDVETQAQTLPPSLQNNGRDVSLRGTVAGQNPDGTTRINTPRGPVDVQLPQPLPARGTEVNLQIPAGNPPRTVTVTLPAQPQVPAQPAPPQSQVPIPQVPTPQIPGQTPVTQNPSMPGQPQQTPAQPPQTQTPAAQVPLPTSIPVPSDAPAPTPQQALPSGIVLLQQTADPAKPQLSPQNLLEFLKTSMQTFLKTPALPTQATGNTLGVASPEQFLASAAQRPLQIGQMVRLTPLPLGQNFTPQPGMPLNAPALPGLAATLTPSPATPNAIVPSSTPTGIAQNLLPQQTIFTTPGMPQTAAVLPTGDTRIILPGSAMATPAIATPASAAAPQALGQLIPASLTPSLPQSVTPQTQHLIISTPNGLSSHTMPVQVLDVRISAVLPTASPPILQNALSTNLIHGTPSTPALFAQVAGQTPQGLPVLEMPTFTLSADGSLKTTISQMVLQYPARGLVPGTIMRLDVLPGVPMTSPVATGMPQATGMSLPWDTLDDLLHTGTASSTQNPQAAALQAAIPKPGAAAFTAPVLMFVAALRGGDITAWMGEKGLEAVRGGRRPDALARLTADFASATQTMREEDARPAGDWKSLNLPLMFGGELARIQLHYRSFDQGQDESKDKTKNGGMRFVMDLALTRMGPMQIDGFSQGRKLDVTLRSEQAMSPSMRDAMRARYRDAVNNIGFSGELNFNADPSRKSWIDIDDHRGTKAAALA